MIVALIIGRKGSIGFPGKNLYPVLGRPLALYPMMAAKFSKFIDKVYISTDCENLMGLSRDNDVEIIERPEELCTNEARGLDVFIHGFNIIKERNKAREIELVVLMFCNAATISAGTIDEGIEAIPPDSQIGDRLILDVRQESETRVRPLKEENVQSIPLGDLRSRWEEIPKDKPILCVCPKGLRSAEAVRILKEKGLNNVVYLGGGILMRVAPKLLVKQTC